MSTEMLGWLDGARDGKKLGSIWYPVNSTPTLSQPDLFQNFALKIPKRLWYLIGSLRFKVSKGYLKVQRIQEVPRYPRYLNGT